MTPTQNNQCNRYKIINKTFGDFGLIIYQGKGELPQVWSHDIMSTTTLNKEIKEVSDKPFCCKFCGFKNYIKYGLRPSKQNYMCKDCGRKFVDNQYLENLKINPKIICLTPDLYLKGISLRKISDHLKQFHDIDVYFTTFYRCIEHYIEIMDEYISQFQPKLGTI